MLLKQHRRYLYENDLGHILKQIKNEMPFHLLCFVKKADNER